MKLQLRRLCGNVVELSNSMKRHRHAMRRHNKEIRSRRLRHNESEPGWEPRRRGRIGFIII